jgi:GT2 family glycosyltransferase
MSIGVVAIGRNEGERLRVCLSSALRASKNVVYVDSGTTDGSVELAKHLGAYVVELDLSSPFTAARARNAGFEKLSEIAPDLEFVQFVDGDCEIVDGWVDRAASEASAKPQAAVLCGRRRERHPEASIYNTLCDIEWNTPIGKALACGGDALIRAKAFREVRGYNDTIIAGEEPEMCVRLRKAGWEIWRIDADMTLHDAAMTRFSQWWKRAVRAGHAFAEGYVLHGKPPERHNRRQVRSMCNWGITIPLLLLNGTVALAVLAPKWLWIVPIVLLIYPLQVIRLALPMRKRAGGFGRAIVWAIFVVLGMTPHFFGLLTYISSRFRGTRTKLIEYKGAGDPVVQSATIK